MRLETTTEDEDQAASWSGTVRVWRVDLKAGQGGG